MNTKKNFTGIIFPDTDNSYKIDLLKFYVNVR